MGEENSTNFLQCSYLDYTAHNVDNSVRNLDGCPIVIGPGYLIL